MSLLKSSPLRLLLVLMLSLSLAACTPSDTPDTTTNSEAHTKPITLGLTYIPNIQFSPFYVAQKEKLFGELPVTLRHHGQNEGLFTALLQGRENLVVAGADEAVKAHADNQDLVVLAPYYTKFPVVIMVPQASEIKSVADLQGKKIGIPGQYGENWFGLKYALKEAGLTTDQVQIQSIGYTQRIALQTGSVDAVVGYQNNDSVQFAQAGFKIREIPLSTDPVPLLGAAIVTTRDFATQHPDSVKQALTGIRAGIFRVIADPDATLEVTAAYVPDIANEPQKGAALATLKATLPLFPRTEDEAKLDQNKVQRMLSALQELEIVPNSVKVSQITVTLP